MDKTQYKDVYVFVEQRDGVVQKVAVELLGKARELADALGERVVAMLLGHDISAKAEELIAYGADVVLCADERELAQYTTEPYAQAIAQIVRERKRAQAEHCAHRRDHHRARLGSPPFRTFGDGIDCRLYRLGHFRGARPPHDPPGFRRQPHGDDYLQGTPPANVHRASRRDACDRRSRESGHPFR